MSYLLQRLVYCRCQRSCLIQCGLFYRTQSARSYNLLQANTISHIAKERFSVCLLEKNSTSHTLFQKLKYPEFNRFHNAGYHGVEQSRCFSTKRDVSFQNEDKHLPSQEEIVDKKSDRRKIIEPSRNDLKRPLASSKETQKDSTITPKTQDGSTITPEMQGGPTNTEPQTVSMITPETSLKDVSKTTIDHKIGDEKLFSRIQRFFLWRFTKYLKKFQQSLENEMPDTFNMFRIFSIGLKDFVLDFKDFIKVLIIISMPGSTLRSLTRREIELYYNMPGDMFRVFPILVISSIPFGQNIAFPIGYWFPKHLLCHHFWDIKQKHDFSMISMKKRLFNARPVFRSMQATLLTITQKEYQDKCRAVFYKLGSGIHPTPAEIVAVLPLFQGYPFHISRIRLSHVNGLLRLHGKSVWLRRRQGLFDHARMIHYLDTAISREGLDSLTYDQLKASLFLRGLNPTNMSTDSMRDFMERWLTVSREVDASSYSLLLHLPILLAYNHPTNFVLIY